MEVRIAWGGKTRSLMHPRNFLDPAQQIRLVGDWYESVGDRFYKDEDELAPPVKVILFADYHRRTRIRPQSGIIELDLQTAYDIVGLARYFGEWTDGVRAALHDILRIVAEIYAANGQWRAARAFGDYRRQLAQQGSLNNCTPRRPQWPDLLAFRVVDDQFSDCVKAFLYFHEERHYQHEVGNSRLAHTAAADFDCDDYARIMLETIAEQFLISDFISSIDVVLFFAILIKMIAEYAAYLLDDPLCRKARFEEVLKRSSRIADCAIFNDIVNHRPYPSLPQPYIDRAKQRSMKYRSGVAELLAELEKAFVHIATGGSIRACTSFCKRKSFLRVIDEIEASADE
jgi:hypothetical protein